MLQSQKSGNLPCQNEHSNHILTNQAIMPGLKTTRRTGLLLVGAILLMLALVACGDDGPTAISKAEMGTGVDNTSITGVTTTLKPTDTFYAGVTLTNPKATTTVKGTLTAVETSDGSKNKVVTDTSVTTANSETFVSFKFTLPTAWPTGKYKVDILLNGAAAQTLNFEVQ